MTSESPITAQPTSSNLPIIIADATITVPQTTLGGENVDLSNVVVTQPISISANGTTGVGGVDLNADNMNFAERLSFSIAVQPVGEDSVPNL